MKVLAGKKALVTGAASGIGRATALALAREGVQLYLLDVNQVALDNLAATLRQQGTKVIARVCDLRDTHDLDRNLGELLEQWGGVDIVVNNAGAVYYGPTMAMSDEQWEGVVSLNLLAPTRIIRRLLPSLSDRGEAHIVNVCSLAGLVGFKRFSAYCLTKFGLLGFSESLRCELAKSGVGVTAVCPGFVRTDIQNSALRPNGKMGVRLPSPWICASPEAVASRIVVAVRKNRFLLVITPVAHLCWLIKRCSPAFWPTLAIGIRRRRKNQVSKPEATWKRQQTRPSITVVEQAEQRAA